MSWKILEQPSPRPLPPPKKYNMFLTFALFQELSLESINFVLTFEPVD